MQRLAILSPVILFGINAFLAPAQRFQNCLPPGITTSDVVSVQQLKSTNTIKKTTVEQKLIELKARCKRGKLVDAAGKEIYFFRMAGCWGNPPADYLEILEQQNKELEKLRKRYTVIEMTCNPEGLSIH